MADCVFCKIVKGEVPSYKVHEDKDYLAFLSIEPLNLGHCLIIPKKHYRYADQVPNFGEYFEVAKKVGNGIKKATGHEHLYFLTVGNEIKHAHIWVTPHYDGDGHGNDVNWQAIKKLSESQMKKIAKKISDKI